VIDRSLLVLVNGESALCDQPTTMAAVVMLSAGAMEQHHTVARDLDEKVCRLDFMHDVVSPPSWTCFRRWTGAVR
jgi:hypothetical protein